MDPRRIASVAALVGGVGWLVKVALIWANGGENLDSGPVAVFYFLGVLGLVVALAALGYTLVERAPVWLRALVTVATPVLGLMLWSLLDQAIRAVYTSDDWFREEAAVLLAAIVATVLGLRSLRRRGAGSAGDDAPVASEVRGRRAAR